MRWGIEVEAEFDGDDSYHDEMVRLIDSQWTISNDPSLRNTQSYEFKFIRSFNLETTLRMIDEMEGFLINNHGFQESIRAGVHINFSSERINYNISYLKKMLPIYYILEPLLVDYCDPRRSGNLFCMKIENCIHEVSPDFKYLQNFKYLALRQNMELQCLEYRALTTTKCFDKVVRMILFFDQLETYVLSNKIVPFKDLLTELSIRQGTNLEKLEDLTGIDLEFLRKDGDHQCRRILKNMRLIQPLFIKG